MSPHPGTALHKQAELKRGVGWAGGVQRGREQWFNSTL